MTTLSIFLWKKEQIPFEGKGMEEIIFCNKKCSLLHPSPCHYVNGAGKGILIGLS